MNNHITIDRPGAGIAKITIQTQESQDGRAGVFIELENGVHIDVDTGEFQAIHYGVGAPDMNWIMFADILRHNVKVA